jgi:hypothetical protein
MNIKKPIFPFVCLILLASVALGESRQKEGQQLIKQALELSNIRAQGAPAFRLKAVFRVSDQPSPNEGTYSEIWISWDKWRREIEMGGFQRTEVGGTDKKRWQIDSGGEAPSWPQTLMRVLGYIRLPEEINVRSIKDKDVAGTHVRCVETDGYEGVQAFCIDRVTGVLLLHERWSENSRSHFSEVYRNYQKFGGYLVPRTVQFMKEGKSVMDLNVTDISATGRTDPSQFAPMPGAKELSNCAVNIPPRAVFTPDPGYPEGAKATQAKPVLWMNVGKDGIPHDLKVVQSAGGAFDSVALKAVSQWRFKPATCDGEPISAKSISQFRSVSVRRTDFQTNRPLNACRVG